MSPARRGPAPGALDTTPVQKRRQTASHLPDRTAPLGSARQERPVRQPWGPLPLLVGALLGCAWGRAFWGPWPLFQLGQTHRLISSSAPSAGLMGEGRPGEGHGLLPALPALDTPLATLGQASVDARTGRTVPGHPSERTFLPGRDRRVFLK